jgi:hypothetical protein
LDLLQLDAAQLGGERHGERKGYRMEGRPMSAPLATEQEMQDTKMKKHFVTFYSPGTFVAESSVKEIEAWDPKLAQRMAEEITERHNAVPYGFRFHTMTRLAGEWEPKCTGTSPMHYLPHCKVETLAEIEARNDPKDKILLQNMRGNGYDRIVVTTKGWRWTQPISANDVVLT